MYFGTQIGNGDVKNEIANLKLATLADAVKDAGRGSGDAQLVTLAAESAKSIVGGARIEEQASNDIKNAYKSAERLVNAAVAAWETSIADRAQFESLMHISHESATAMGDKARDVLHDFARIKAISKAHAVQALVLGADQRSYMRMSESAQSMRQRALANTPNAIVQHGFHDRTLANMVSGRSKLTFAAENFADTPTQAMLARYAVVYHTAAQRQEAAVEAAYPTLLLPIDQLGVHMTVRVVTAIQNVRHSLDGTPFNLNRENVLNAMVHPEQFRANQTKLIPCYVVGNAANKAHFVDPALFLPEEVNYDRIPESGLTPAELAANKYATNLLAIDDQHNVIGLSQPIQGMNGGQRNFTDTLNPAVNLFKVGISFPDPAAPTDKTKFENFRIDVSEISSAFATEAFDGDTRMVQFNFRTTNVLLTPKNILKLNSAGALVTTSANGVPATRLETLIASGTKAVPVKLADDLRLEIGFTLNGTLNLQTGEASVSSGRVALYGVTGGDPYKPVRYPEGSPQWTAAAAYVNVGRVVGYSFNGTFENLNAREYGTKIDSVDMRHFVEVNTHPPITAVGPVMGAQEGIQPDRIQNLQFHAYALQSGLGIEHMLKHNKLCDLQYRGEVNLEMKPTTTLGVSSYNVNTFYRALPVDAEASVSGTTNMDIVDNFRSYLANIVLRWAAEADIESRLQIWRETCYGGQAPAPTVLFVIDPILNPYMFTPGDTRLLGDRYPFLVHQSYNAKVRGKILMYWVDPTNNSAGGPNMMNHGNTLSKAEVVLKLPTWREGGTQVELGLAQCFRHVAHLPLGAELTVTNIDALLTTKVSREINIAGTVETHEVP